MIKALIFDLDGTLLDSLGDITNSVNYALRMHNQPLRSFAQVKKSLGYGANFLISSLVQDKTIINEVLMTYLNYYKTNDNIITAPYDGIDELLGEIKGKYKLAIVSNKTDSIVKQLNKNIFSNLFEVAIGEQEGMRLKPEPDLLNFALKELEVSSDQAIFFGDTEVDLQTGINANIKTGFVEWGFRDFVEVEHLAPKYIINKPNDILLILNKIDKVGK